MSDIINETPTMELRFLERQVTVKVEPFYQPNVVTETHQILQQKWTIQRRAFNERGIEFSSEWREVPTVSKP